ncbi:MAG TPA: type II toxin-antitoxin system RelE/ParE family toxin [Nitrospira sp.]|nr:type II toxin-antitoxin system RelE/ParE family toxin [Nitrospira sp.]
MTLHLTDAAEADLAEIWGYIATEVGETTATRYLDRITKTIDVVRHSPLIGTTRDRLSMGLRVTFHHPYAIYYQVTQRTLIVVRVLHGARDAAAIAEQGGFVH